jgi:hypothetical protein
MVTIQSMNENYLIPLKRLNYRTVPFKTALTVSAFKFIRYIYIHREREREREREKRERESEVLMWPKPSYHYPIFGICHIFKSEQIIMLGVGLDSTIN